MFTLILLAGLIELSTAIPYIIDIRRGKTVPALESWSTWLILSLIAAFASFAAGAVVSGVISSALVLECLLIIIGSLKKGKFTYTQFDFYCQIAALLALALWWWTKAPLAALIIFVIVDAIGALPTLRHAWRRPFEETFYTFSFSILGNGLALATIPVYTLSDALVPGYLLVLNTVISGEIYFRKRRLKA